VKSAYYICQVLILLLCNCYLADILTIDPDYTDDTIKPILEHETITHFRIRWQPNSESDLAGYKWYWLTEAGDLRQVDNLGNVTEKWFNIQKMQGVVYFALTAYDYTGNELTIDKVPHYALSVDGYDIELNVRESND